MIFKLNHDIGMQVFKSQVSYGLLFFLVIIIGFPIPWSLIDKGISTSSLIFSSIMALTLALIISLFLNTKYIIDQNLLVIKSGFLMTKKVDIEKITRIVKTNSLLASPAPSFDRIEISYGKFDSIIISPKDKIGFSNALKSINRNIVIELVEF
jgi:hypothetical protein